MVDLKSIVTLTRVNGLFHEKNLELREKTFDDKIMPIILDKIIESAKYDPQAYNNCINTLFVQRLIYRC